MAEFTFEETVQADAIIGAALSVSLHAALAERLGLSALERAEMFWMAARSIRGRTALAASRATDFALAQLEGAARIEERRAARPPT